MTEQDPNREREPIWSVPPGRLAQYFALFTLFATLGLGFLLWYEIFENAGDTLPQTIRAIIQGLGLNTAGSAGMALQIVEGPKFVMVLADYFTKKWLNPLKEQLREEGREKGRQEGREEGRQEGHEEGRQEGREEAAAQVNAQWRDWLRRRMEAEGRGERFDEPPPSGDAPEDGAG